MALAKGATIGDNRLPAGQSQRGDQEQNKYGTRSHRDSLEKIEKEQTQSHGSIVEPRRNQSEITMVILTIYLWARSARPESPPLERS